VTLPSTIPSTILSTTLAGIPLRNPIILAAGTAGVLDEMADVLDLSRIGAVVSKSITVQPRQGNQTWRILPAGPAGMLNAIGLANPGLDAFIEHYLPKVKALPCKLFVSVAGFSVEDYVAVAANVDAWSHENRLADGSLSVPAIELNVSCPNVKAGGEAFGGAPGTMAELVDAVRPHVRHAKLFVKLSPMLPNMVAIAKAAVQRGGGGADGLTLCNTMPAMAIDVASRRPKLAHVTGGLSGPALHPVVVKHLFEVRRGLEDAVGSGGGVGGTGVLPALIGLGGVMHWEHAAEFILAGASAVQMGTVLFADPRAPISVAKGLEKWCRSQRAGNIGQLVGQVDTKGANG